MLFNAAKLLELRSMLGPDQSARIVSRFSADLSVRVDDLAAISHHHASLGEAAHKLVAIAGSLGFDQLAAEAQGISHAARQGDNASYLGFRCENLAQTSRLSLEALKSFLDQVAS